MTSSSRPPRIFRRPLIAAVAALLIFAAVFAVRTAGRRAGDSQGPQYRLAIVGFFDVEASILADAAKELGLHVDVYTRKDFLSAPDARSRGADKDAKRGVSLFGGSNVGKKSSKKGSEKGAEQEYPRYNAAIMRCMGLQISEITDASRAQFEACDVLVPFPGTGDFFDLYGRNVGGITGEITQTYLQTITPRNAKAFLSLIIRETNPDSPLAAEYANMEIPAPEELPESGFIYRGLEVSPDYQSWLARPDIPRLPADAPVAALVGAFINPYKSGDAAALSAVVEAYAARGIRAVPIYGVKRDPALLESVKPNLVVVFPLGKLLADEDGVDLFKRLDVPVLSAINLSAPESEWRSEPVGMTTTYQNLAIALPELEGTIEPTAVATMESDEEGREFRVPIMERVNRLADRSARWLALRTKPNAEKRLAFFYRRGPGAAAIVAQSLDPVPSLYNVLLDLREHGYDLGDDFPESYEAFADLLDKRGRTIGQWAPGAFRQFLADASPERVPAALYNEWSERLLSEQLRRETRETWGPAPGLAFAGQDPDVGAFVAVTRLVFGNVVIMPEPTTAIVAEDAKGDDFGAAHGTNKAPPHFYQAAYLWAREGFRADAVVHFGTHGYLEFTRGKSALLTENDWPDALAGDLPDVYLYSVNNVGEALLAKRRILAVLVSHTTPPFRDAELNDETTALTAALDALENAQDADVRAELAAEVERLAEEAGLVLFSDTFAADALHTDEAARAQDVDAHDEHDDDADDGDHEHEHAAAEEHDHAHGDAGHEHDLAELRGEFYREQLQRLTETAVSDGLHVLGRPWTEEQLQTTAAAIGTDDALENLRLSTGGLELDRFRAALEGRFIPPSTGGDPVVNPASLPSGRNMAGANIEQTPDPAVCRLAQRLTDELIDEFKAKNGRYPRRVAITLWGGEYLRTRGLSAAQALWLLGVRPVFDKKGAIRDLEVVPAEELGRPRVDVLIQTSGQFRDAAPSRVELLDRAVRLVAALEDEPFPNFVKENTASTASELTAKGYLPEEASELATARIFGATHALDYGTGIRKTVERSDQWETRGEIADRYILNMSGIYRNGKVWGTPIEGLLESNLAGTDVIMQSRSSNLWGPVKLDHLYEFGTLATVVREKTGVDPTFILADARRPANVRNQSLADAMRDELQTTFWSKKWLQNLQRERGGAGGAALAKATQNLFGWSAVGADGLVDDATWRRTVDTIVNDSLDIGLDKYLEETNPAALAECAAVALDAARKGFWTPSDEERRNLAGKLADVVAKNGAPCSYNVCANKKLREFVLDALDPEKADQFRHDLDAATTVPEDTADVSGITMVETSPDSQKQQEEATDPGAPAVPRPSVPDDPEIVNARRILLLAALALVLAGLVNGLRKRR